MGLSISNISTTSGLYSQLAGVLAGFAFTALVLILTARLDPAVQAGSPAISFAKSTRMLVIAFLGLVITSVNYAALAGDSTNSARTGFLEPLDGLVFAISAAVMLYAIALTLDAVTDAPGGPHADLRDVARFLRMILGVFVVPLLLLLLLLGLQDLENGSPPGAGSVTGAQGMQPAVPAGVPIPNSADPSIANQKPAMSTLDTIFLYVIIIEWLLGGLYYFWRRTFGSAGPLSGPALDRSVKRLGNVSFYLMIGASITATAISAKTQAPSHIWIGWPVSVMTVSVAMGVAFLHHVTRART